MTAPTTAAVTPGPVAAVPAVAAPTIAQQILAYAEAALNSIATLGPTGANAEAVAAQALSDIATFKAQNRGPTKDEWAVNTSAMAAGSADLDAQAKAAQAELDAEKAAAGTDTGTSGV